MKLTREVAQQMYRDDEMIEFVVAPWAIEGLVEWLDSRGIDLMQGPPAENLEEHPFRWFVASPRSPQK
jgi:hypothetical protein